MRLTLSKVFAILALAQFHAVLMFVFWKSSVRSFAQSARALWSVK